MLWICDYPGDDEAATQQLTSTVKSPNSLPDKKFLNAPRVGFVLADGNRRFEPFANVMSTQTTTSALLWRETGKLLEDTDGFADVESLIRAHTRLVFKIAYGAFPALRPWTRVLRNSHDAEDVVQEVFLRLHCCGTKDIRDLPAWLARMTFRLAIDHRRKPEAVDLAGLEVPAEEPGAEKVAIHRQRVERVHRLIAALPNELRYPLVLSAIAELDSRHISRMLGIPVASVRGRIFRARQILKEKLAALAEKKR